MGRHFQNSDIAISSLASFASLAHAVSVIGSSQTTLCVGTSTTVTDNLTVPSNITLQVARGAIITILTSKTLTLNCQVEAGVYQIFAGPGLVRGNMLGSEVWIEWWGAVPDGDSGSPTDNTAVLQAAVDWAEAVSASQPPTLNIGNGTFMWTGTITHLSDTGQCYLEGRGYYKTNLLHQPASPNTDAIFFRNTDAPPGDYTVNNALRNVTLRSFTANTRYLVRVESQHHFRMKNVHLVGGYATLYVDWVTDFLAESCEFYSSSYANVLWGSSGLSTSAAFRDCFFRNGTADGLRMGYVYSLVLDHCYLEYNGAYGIRMGAGSDRGGAIILSGGTTFEGNTSGPLYCGSPTSDTCSVSASDTSWLIGAAVYGLDLGKCRVFLGSNNYFTGGTFILRVNRGGTNDTGPIEFATNPDAAKQMTALVNDERAGGGISNIIHGSRGSHVEKFQDVTTTSLTHDIRDGSTVNCHVSDNLTINAPTGGLVAGQVLTFRFSLEATGKNVSWNSIFSTSWSNAGNNTYPASSIITFIYDGTSWREIFYRPWTSSAPAASGCMTHIVWPSSATTTVSAVDPSRTTIIPAYPIVTTRADEVVRVDLSGYSTCNSATSRYVSLLIDGSEHVSSDSVVKLYHQYGANISFSRLVTVAGAAGSHTISCVGSKYSGGETDWTLSSGVVQMAITQYPSSIPPIVALNSAQPATDVTVSSVDMTRDTVASVPFVTTTPYEVVHASFSGYGYGAALATSYVSLQLDSVEMVTGGHIIDEAQQWGRNIGFSRAVTVPVPGRHILTAVASRWSGDAGNWTIDKDTARLDVLQYSPAVAGAITTTTVSPSSSTITVNQEVPSRSTIIAATTITTTKHNEAVLIVFSGYGTCGSLVASYVSLLVDGAELISGDSIVRVEAQYGRDLSFQRVITFAGNPGPHTITVVGSKGVGGTDWTITQAVAKLSILQFPGK